LVGIEMFNAANKSDHLEQAIVQIENPAPFSPLYDGTTVEQSFSSSFQSISKVSIYVATYLKTNLPGEGLFQIMDPSRKILVSREFKLSNLKDNTYVTFNFKSIDLKPGEKYFLRLTSDVKPPATTYTVWTNQNFQDKSFVLKENSKILTGAIVFNLTGK